LETIRRIEYHLSIVYDLLNGIPYRHFRLLRVESIRDAYVHLTVL
jgi:hypothetical protein